MLACCFTGCEKEVITVAGIQNPEVREDQYIVVENFELKQIEDNGKDAIACCAILIPGRVRGILHCSGDVCTFLESVGFFQYLLYSA